MEGRLQVNRLKHLRELDHAHQAPLYYFKMSSTASRISFNKSFRLYSRSTWALSSSSLDGLLPCSGSSACSSSAWLSLSDTALSPADPRGSSEWSSDWLFGVPVSSSA